MGCFSSMDTALHLLVMLPLDIIGTVSQKPAHATDRKCLTFPMPPSLSAGDVTRGGEDDCWEGTCIISSSPDFVGILISDLQQGRNAFSTLTPPA